MIKALADRMALLEGTARACLDNRRAVSMFRDAIGRYPRLAPPETYNDKFHWRKFFDHDPKWVVFNDKLAVKDWVRARLPDLAVPKVLWQGENPDDLPAGLLNSSVVIKANHGCGYNIFPDDAPPDMQAIRATLRGWLDKAYGKDHGEWAYGRIPRRIFVEERVRRRDGTVPELVNVQLFGSEVRFVVVMWTYPGQPCQMSFLSTEGERLPLWPLGYDRAPLPEDWRPGPGFFKAVETASALAPDVDYLRCDFLNCDEVLWFSELTTYEASGRAVYDDLALAERLYGWDIRNSWFMRSPQSGWRERYRRALARQLARSASRDAATEPR